MAHSRRLPSRLLCAINLLLIGGIILFSVLNRSDSGEADAFGFGAFDLMLPMVFGGMGFLLTQRAPGNAVGWLFCSIGIFGGLNAIARGYAVYGYAAVPGPLPGVALTAWAHNWAWVPLVVQASVFLLLLFPDGRILPGWRPVAILAALAAVGACAGIAIEPGELEEFPALDNPVGVGSALEPVVAGLISGSIVLVIICTAAGAASQIVRYRRSGPDERHQIKWFAAAAGLVACTFALQMAVFAPELITNRPLLSHTASELLEASMQVAMLTIPIATGIAVLRYRLYDIDVLINRTLVYVPLTAILAGLYVAMAGLLRAVLEEVTGAGSDAVIALSTLFIVAMLTPLKNNLQGIVDRRFKEAPDPLRSLHELTAQAQSVLQVVESDRFVREFLTKAMAAFGATGAAVSVATPNGGKLSVAVGEPVIVTEGLAVPLNDDGVTAGSLLLGPRTNGQPYTSNEADSLMKAASVVTEVVKLRH